MATEKYCAAQICGTNEKFVVNVDEIYLADSAGNYTVKVNEYDIINCNYGKKTF